MLVDERGHSERDRSYISFLLLELAGTTISPSEWMAHFMASCVETGMDVNDGIIELTTAIRRYMELTVSHMDGREPIWPGLLPGGPAQSRWEIIDTTVSTKPKPGVVYDKSKLDYGIDIHIDEDVFHCPMGAEFFMDEHGFQWVKFYPTNGPDNGREHMYKMRDGIWFVRIT
jgi:hypothetical protein